MYGEYTDFIPLSEEEILKRVSQEEIIEMALGYKPVPFQRIISPFRPKDTKAGAWFEWHNNRLFFQDFADNPTHRIPFRFIADFYKIEFIEALRLINQHFSLGLGIQGNISVPPKPVLYQSPEQYHSPEKQRANIIYKPRPFLFKDKNFWTKMHITKAQLIEDEVNPAIWYKVYSHKLNKWIVTRPYDLTYVFAEFNERVKIYRPNADSNHKWITNCDENDIGAFKKLPTSGKNLIISKAYKDCRVIRNEKITSIWFQNEGCVPKDEIIIQLCESFDHIYFFYDNDNAGIKAAIKLCSIFNAFYPGKASPLHLPESLLQEKIKDPTDLIVNKSLKAFQEFLIEKNLY